jgi:hypothetical protein
MSEYKSEDFETYARCFSLEATRVVELMRILNETLQIELEMQTMQCMSPRDLFRMVLDLSYDTDRAYKKEKNIGDEPFNITNDELSSQLRTLLRDELQRYFAGNDGETK